MIIGITGAQGQGKSTLIQAAIEDPEVRYVNLELQTARELLTDWNYSLAQVNAYMPLKIRYQEELLERHVNNLKKATANSNFLAERTFADIFVYALVSVGPFNDHSHWLNDYYDRCCEAQAAFFKCVIHLTGRKYTPENDGVRSVNTHFSDMIEALMHKYIMRMGASSYSDMPVQIINDPSIDGRVEALNKIVRFMRDK